MVNIRFVKSSILVKWNVYVFCTIEFEAAVQLASKQELLSMIVMLIKSPYFNLWYRQRWLDQNLESNFWNTVDCKLWARRGMFTSFENTRDVWTEVTTSRGLLYLTENSKARTMDEAHTKLLHYPLHDFSLLWLSQTRCICNNLRLLVIRNVLMVKSQYLDLDQLI